MADLRRDTSLLDPYAALTRPVQGLTYAVGLAQRQAYLDGAERVAGLLAALRRVGKAVLPARLAEVSRALDEELARRREDVRAEIRRLEGR